jgi:predicted nucleotidyltransferase
MSKMRRHRPRDPSPSVAEPRRPLLLGAYSFVRAARLCPGVRHIALLGSLATAKAVPKDVDLLVTVERATDLILLARAGRRLKGLAQTINLGADIFLADTAGQYLGRICHYRECHPRAACRAKYCGLRKHLNDDLHLVTLSKDLLASPPIELWPKVIRRLAVPEDVEEILLAKLERDQ